MAGIAGIARRGQSWLVNVMLDRMAHRGSAGRAVVETSVGTMGVIWPQPQFEAGVYLEKTQAAMDEVGAGHYALAAKDFSLKRDPLGVAPLYFGRMMDGTLCFASEVKALLEATLQVEELPPGHIYDGRDLHPYETLTKQAQTDDPFETVAQELRCRLEAAVEKCTRGEEMGVWLSGGLDSSVMAALARPHVKQLHTFAAGLPGAPDLEYAQAAARHLKCKHHEITVQLKDILNVLPMVIYHLESFDTWLVRSSVMNFLAARKAAGYVLEVFSGEGGDELFAGYDYLKSIDPAKLDDELVHITSSLHNTALQRVDRCASAFGLVAHVPFMDPDIVKYALRIPARYKLQEGDEKQILRLAMVGTLPEEVLRRPKAKFWQGAGVQDLLAQYADEHITMTEFMREQRLPNGWLLASREELMYYRIFRDHFGKANSLSWMGRSNYST